MMKTLISKLTIAGDTLVPLRKKKLSNAVLFVFKCLVYMHSYLDQLLNVSEKVM